MKIYIKCVSKKIVETDLPGIGKKYTLKPEGQGSIVVAILNSGKREIYFMSDNEDCQFSIDLTEDEAKDLGFILSGAIYEPVKLEKMDLILKEAVIEWVKIEKDSELANKTIGELQIRKKTGVSIIAIDRNGKVIPNPDPYSEKMTIGDKLIVVGTRQQIKNFQDIFKIK